MSMWPHFIRTPTLFGQHFGLPLSRQDLIHPNPYFQRLEKRPTHDENHLQLNVDVQHFTPEEISVKTIGNQIVVEAKHEEKADEHGYVYRHFVRKYQLPERCNPEHVTSSVSTDGILTIDAPGEPISLPDKNERIVPIQHTGPAHSINKPVHHEHPHPTRPHRRQEPEVILAIKYI